MARETTSKRVAAIGAKGMKNPGKLTHAEIKAVCASVVTQREIANDRTHQLRIDMTNIERDLIDLLAVVRMIKRELPRQ